MVKSSLRTAICLSRNTGTLTRSRKRLPCEDPVRLSSLPTPVLSIVRKKARPHLRSLPFPHAPSCYHCRVDLALCLIDRCPALNLFSKPSSTSRSRSVQHCQRVLVFRPFPAMTLYMNPASVCRSSRTNMTFHPPLAGGSLWRTECV